MSILKRKKSLIKIWEKSSSLIEDFTSEELLEVTMDFIKDEGINHLIIKDFNQIINRCTTDYDMYNFFTILTLKTNMNGIHKEICEKSINSTVKRVFSKETYIYLLKKFKKFIENGFITRDKLFNDILEELKTFDTKKSSMILFDLFIFPDFKVMLEKKHRVIATLIESYQLYDPDLMSSQFFNGSSIIGKLLQDENEEIIAKYLRDMLKEKQISPRNIQMIGGGGSNLVYKINDLVFKIGETRNCRKIYINHRILASIIRKLLFSADGKELFYVEQMIYCSSEGITLEEKEELKLDLYRQGLIWEDDKLINCGLLPEGYENKCDLPVDYIEVAGCIDNPVDREEFMKRTRKVVVIDNDDIRLNPKKLWR